MSSTSAPFILHRSIIYRILVYMKQEWAFSVIRFDCVHWKFPFSLNFTQLKPRPHVFFFPDTLSVHTYPANSLANPDLFEYGLQSGNFLIRYEYGTVWTLNPEIILSAWLNKIEPSSLPWNQFSRWLPRASWRMLCYLCFLEESWILQRIRIRFGYVWTGKFDLNTLRVDGNIFESGKKKLRIQKYPDTFGRGLMEYVLSSGCLKKSAFLM